MELEAELKTVLRINIFLRALSLGHIVEHKDQRYGMDENFDVGFVFTKDEEEVIVGDRLTVGHVAKLVKSMSDDEIFVLAAKNALLKTRHESRIHRT